MELLLLALALRPLLAIDGEKASVEIERTTKMTREAAAELIRTMSALRGRVRMLVVMPEDRINQSQHIFLGQHAKSFVSGVCTLALSLWAGFSCGAWWGAVGAANSNKDDDDADMYNLKFTYASKNRTDKLKFHCLRSLNLIF